MSAIASSLHGCICNEVLLLQYGPPCFPRRVANKQSTAGLFQKTAAAAKEASDAATPKVLEFFDSAEFRRVLKDCCADVAELPSQELLRRYRAEAQVAELSHALPSEQKGGISVFDDVTESELGNLSWFPNEFQTSLMHNVTPKSARINNFAQQRIFGSSPFAGKRPTWPEAANRLIYIAHNLRRLDTGSLPGFGDLTVVFNTSRVRNSVVIAPYDTGLYTMNCLVPEYLIPKAKKPLNCSAWTSAVVGTLDHFDHLILPNLQVPYNRSFTNETWRDGVRTLWARAFTSTPYEDLPGLNMKDMGNYLEADILANPRLPHAVKHVIGNFPRLFGTDDGRKLQRIAAKRSWPLFWAVGYGDPGKHDKNFSDPGRFPSNQRFADPSIAARPAGACRAGRRGGKCQWCQTSTS
ncbi:unnamed protein product [Symbiodinium natans]|uniref:Uncharacterized protein n=1 Tax=Symbiodinium natans TaxID=878477 RepID=A0A812V7R8_9DINO|nr:unnamed protein product [Symbiodinium natans]